MMAFLYGFVCIIALLFPTTAPINSSVTGPYSWEVAKDEKRIIQASSKVLCTFTITVTQGAIFVREGDIDNPGGGDGKRKVSARQSYTITPNQENDLYLVGINDLSTGTYDIAACSSPK